MSLLDNPAFVSLTTKHVVRPTVAVVGLGYVGLPTALAFCAAEADVVGIDVATSRLDAIRRMDVDLIPSDQERLERALQSEAFSMGSDPAMIQRADAVVICVPTPIDEHLSPDLRALKAACTAVVENAREGQLIVLTSTSYVGTTRDLLVEPFRARGLHVGNDVAVAFSPERIDPGNVVYTQDVVPRVVGGVTQECGRRAAALLSLLTSSVHVVESPEVAEFTKLYENTFRAVNIAFANEMADVARQLGVNVIEAIQAASTKPFGFMPFYPGPGVGGHCIPCDPHYLLWQLRAVRARPGLVDEAMAQIAARPRQVVARAGELLAEHGRTLAGARVLVVGAAYKPCVRDVRESPALEIIKELQERGAEVSFTDEYVDEIEVPTGSMHRVHDPANGEWDLAIVHTAHPDVDHDWLVKVPLVLDTTYRLASVDGAVL